MKKELLIPVGNKESLIMAVENGADAVYLGGKNFGARKYASNFTEAELQEATSYCHLYGVKIYITVNTIIYENELEICLNYLNYLYNIGVDAVIVQDLGLIKLIRSYLPNLEIHVSTQATIHNIDQIKYLEQLGVKRVVLAREMSLNDINKLDTNLELEVFIHGALCICYSGSCLLSSQVLSRSGNRGECAGLCRLKYNLKDSKEDIIKNKYLLSPKELATFSYFEALKNSSIYSFKVEGRMKSPEYVGYVTKIYRKLLDIPNYKLTPQELFNLKSLYNRGFTKGFLFNEQDEDFINMASSNHQGVKIGNVIKYNSKYITLKLNHELNQNDAIRLPNNTGMYINYLYDKHYKLINKGLKDQIVLIDNKVNLHELGPLYLTINNELNKSINEIKPKKIPLKLKVIAKKNTYLQVTYYDDKYQVTEKGPLVLEASNAPLTKDRILKSLTKLGNTPFEVTFSDITIDDHIFLPISTLNNLRRNLIAKLTLKRTMPRSKPINIQYQPNYSALKSSKNNFKIAILARNKEQITTCLDLNIDIIYVTDPKLYYQFKNPHVYLRLDNIMNNHPLYHQENLLIGEIGSLKYSPNNNIRTDYFLNVVNSSYIELLNASHVQSITLSPELSNDNLATLMAHIPDNSSLELIIYGTLELMIMKYNLYAVNNLNPHIPYFICDNNNHQFPIIKHNDKTILLSASKINKIADIPYYQKLGINTFRLDLYDEDRLAIEKIVANIRKVMH